VVVVVIVLQAISALLFAWLLLAVAGCMLMAA
jgi:hypothetical protein